MIRLTKSTKNTPALRKRIYKAMLKYLIVKLKENDVFGEGFCNGILYGARPIVNWRDANENRFDLESNDCWLIELMAYKPYVNYYDPHFNSSCFWFPSYTSEDILKRIHILEVILLTFKK
jgi:hypothetical protein